MGDTYTEEYVVQLERDKTTKKLITERHLFAGKLHRDGSPAIRRFESDSGALFKEGWYQHGNLCRENGPSLTRWNTQHNVVTFQVWSTSYGLHREGGLPAQFSRNPHTGVINSQEFYEFDKQHNLHGPSCIARDDKTGLIIYEEWRQYGQLTREGDHPAVIERNEITGIVTKEEFWLDGERHRVNGPAYIARDPQTSVVLMETFYTFGNTVLPPSAKRDWSP